MSNFHPLEVVGRGSETQLPVGENVNKLTQQMRINLLNAKHDYRRHNMFY